jgi:hypothetical protein
VSVQFVSFKNQYGMNVAGNLFVRNDIGGDSFVISAAKFNPRIKSVATVSMCDMGAANRDGPRNGVTLEQRRQLLQQQRPTSARSNSAAERPCTPARAAEELTDQSSAIDRSCTTGIALRVVTAPTPPRNRR